MAASYRELLACPACGDRLAESGVTLACEGCGAVYRPTGTAAQWDLRLAVPKTHPVVHRLGPQAGAPVPLFERLPAAPGAARRDLADLEGDLLYGNRLTPELVSHFPKASGPGGWMLDLGCGSRNFERLCRELTGFGYVGIDYGGEDPDLLADAHALPFADRSFDFVLSIAVLEHLAVPDVAMAETLRVLKPGGTFIGTVAFLEPFHLDSYYHMSHLGTARVLAGAGFEIVALAPNAEWSGTRAQAEMTLFPGLPPVVKRGLAAAVTPLSRALWAARRRLRGGETTSNLRRLLETTGGYRFVARRPA